MLDREDIIAIARGATSAIRQVLQTFEARLGLLERQASGIQSVVIQNDEKDRRSFTQIMTMVDGRKIESKFKLIGSMQYRDVYQAGRQYEIGDVVTYDGSMWVVMTESAGVPGKSPGWRLAVKHGQDGKNLK